MTKKQQESLGYILFWVILAATLYHYKPETVESVLTYLIGFSVVVFKMVIGFFMMFWDLLR